jgi:ornithine cyclodeaminase/alanine dehydrogenase-like protein (mu-crystallin family)
MMEGSIISARRTVVCAAVATKRLVRDPDSVNCLGVIGVGEINSVQITILITKIGSIEAE